MNLLFLKLLKFLSYSFFILFALRNNVLRFDFYYIFNGVVSIYFFWFIVGIMCPMYYFYDTYMTSFKHVQSFVESKKYVGASNDENTSENVVIDNENIDDEKNGENIPNINDYIDLLKKLLHDKHFLIRTLETKPGWCMITGATRGIGWEWARLLHMLGWNLILVGRNEDALKKRIGQLKMFVDIRRFSGAWARTTSPSTNNDEKSGFRQRSSENYHHQQQQKNIGLRTPQKLEYIVFDFNDHNNINNEKLDVFMREIDKIMKRNNNTKNNFDDDKKNVNGDDLLIAGSDDTKNVDPDNVNNNVNNNVSNNMIQLLINNVGMFYEYPMPFDQVDISLVDSLMRVNVISHAFITRACLPFFDPEESIILDINSSSSYMHSSPYIEYYASTKSASATLHKKISEFIGGVEKGRKKHNINVISLHPSYISTDLIKSNNKKGKNIVVDAAMATKSYTSSLIEPSAEVFVLNACKWVDVQKYNLFQSIFSIPISGYFIHDVMNYVLFWGPKVLTSFFIYNIHQEWFEKEKKRSGCKTSNNTMFSLSSSLPLKNLQKKIE